MSAVDYGGLDAGVGDYAVLSTTPCDFTTNGLQYRRTKRWDSANVTFSATGSGVALQPSTTYYFNIKNTVLTAAPSCSGVDLPDRGDAERRSNDRRRRPLSKALRERGFVLLESP